MKPVRPYLPSIAVLMVMVILTSSCVAYQNQPTAVENIDFNELIEKRLGSKPPSHLEKNIILNL